MISPLPRRLPRALHSAYCCCAAPRLLSSNSTAAAVAAAAPSRVFFDSRQPFWGLFISFLDVWAFFSFNMKNEKEKKVFSPCCVYPAAPAAALYRVCPARATPRAACEPAAALAPQVLPAAAACCCCLQVLLLLLLLPVLLLLLLLQAAAVTAPIYLPKAAVAASARCTAPESEQHLGKPSKRVQAQQARQQRWSGASPRRARRGARARVKRPSTSTHQPSAHQQATVNKCLNKRRAFQRRALIQRAPVKRSRAQGDAVAAAVSPVVVARARPVASRG
jgi:hypothetical protein